MKKILLLLLLIFITKITINAQTYTLVSSTSGYVYLGNKGNLSQWVDEDGNTLPSWTGGYNIRVREGKNVYIGQDSFSPAIVIDTLFVDGELRNTAYRTTMNVSTLIVSGNGNFKGNNHSGGRLYVNAQNIVLESGAKFAVPSVGSNSYSGLNWTGSIYVEDNVTLSTNGASNNLITLAQINALPGSNPKVVASSNLDGVNPNTNTIILNGPTAINSSLASQTLSIYTEGNDLVFTEPIGTNVTLFADLSTNLAPTTDITIIGNGSGTLNFAPTNNTISSLTMNAASGVTLGAPLAIVNSNYNQSALTLTNGTIKTTETNLLSLDQFSFVANAIYDWNGHASGGSNTSFIDGPISKVIHYSSALQAALSISGNNFFLMMPVGKGNKLREAGIGQPTANTPTTFRLEYFNTAHDHHRTIDPNAMVDAVSAFEYWNVDRITGTASSTVVLTFSDESGINTSAINDAHVMHFDGAKWESQGAQAYNTNGDDSGTLLSDPATSFSPFTLGGNMQDLPVELIYFNGTKNIDNSVELTWETGTEINNSHFEVEGSVDGREFNYIDDVDGNGNSNVAIEYNYTVSSNDAHGLKYFRLRQVDFDGAYEYSNIVSIATSIDKDIKLTVYPNPAKDRISTQFVLNTEDEIKTAVIFNSIGNTVKNIDLSNGISAIKNINLNGFNNGIYFIKISTASGAVQTKRFLVKN
ncbi:T9SS type A sorting domain-containing protein [Flammeovirga pectinis]|uniref:T9SS type A sorting domain-containing protein n=1 Tax=Flammeovirga pectinis TaxID=2494373 RepID=A0A3S9P3H3_9BACT|nr:T9SS type A sorting domain-containing protein [Flammeovirga pectinis]AZQ62779.1 T9SS type A sorting domain-containing protein [Flammeovirga pectinis]